MNIDCTILGDQIANSTLDRTGKDLAEKRSICRTRRWHSIYAAVHAFVVLHIIHRKIVDKAVTISTPGKICDMHCLMQHDGAYEKMH